MTSSLPLIAAELLHKPLLVQESYLHVALSALADRLDIQPLVSEDKFKSQHRPERETYFDKNAGIAVVPVVGGLTHRAGYAAASGQTGYTGLQSELAGLAKRGAKSILLDMDTPGGAVSGVMETAKFITKLRENGVRVWALSNDLMASAGYWLGAATERVYASPLSFVGSVGVVTTHVDRSGELAKRGLVMTHVHAGARKVDGSSLGPLTDEARAAMQSTVDNIYNHFVAHVAQARGMKEDAVRGTEAALLSADQALSVGLIDSIASYSEVVDALRTVTITRSRVSGKSFTPTATTSLEVAVSEPLTYSQADMDAAVQRATATATADANRAAEANTTAAVAAAVSASRTELLNAMSEVFGADERLTVFSEALADGGSVAFATKFAKKVSGPAGGAPAAPAAPASLAPVFAAAAPNVPTGAPAATGNVQPPAANPWTPAPTAEDRAAFLSMVGIKATNLNPNAVA